MINQQLIDYIKKEAQRGVSEENTKSALFAIGWSKKDIEEAYGGSSVSAPSGSGKKFIWIFVIVLLFIGGGALGYMYYYTSQPTPEALSVVNTPAPTENVPLSPPVTPSPAPVSAPSDTDKVTTIMENICQGYFTKDVSLISQNATAQTIPLISGAKIGTIETCTVNKVYQSGTNIIASMTVTPLEKPGAELLPISDMIFVKEGDAWKFDIVASTKFVADQNKARALTGDPEGLSDLVVTKVVVSPARPVVNKKDVKITVTIKNMGTKTSEKGTPLTLSLEGFNDSIPVSGGSYEPLLPLGTTEWVWYPYKYNDLLKVSDVAGQKTIKVELNSGKSITESDYENNTFSQVVQMYAK